MTDYLLMDPKEAIVLLFEKIENLQDQIDTLNATQNRQADRLNSVARDAAWGHVIG